MVVNGQRYSAPRMAIAKFSTGRQALFPTMSNRIFSAAIRDIEQERSSMRFPEEEDIKGAAEGFVRLQKTYKINTEDFAAGKIPGVTTLPPLSALDCYLIGHRLAQEGVSYDYAAAWLEIALRKFAEEKEEMPKIRKVDIVDWLQYAYYHGGNPVRALELTEQVAELDPDFPTLESNTKFYTNLISGLPEKDYLAMKNESRPPPLRHVGGPYESLCRGEGNLVRCCIWLQLPHSPTMYVW